MFVGRTVELATLNGCLDEPEPRLIVVTGRARIGKSRLIREVCKNRTAIIHQAAHETARPAFESFRRTCLTQLGVASGMDLVTDWPSALNRLASIAQDCPGLVLVLDNYSALHDADESLTGHLRTFWKSGLPAKSGLKLILSDGNTEQMIDLTRGGPTRPQHTLADYHPFLLDLKPLPLETMSDFFPDYSGESRIVAYGIFGGVPGYLSMCQPERSLITNIIELLLQPDGRLVTEPIVLLRRQLRDVKVYASILRAISVGYRESGEIKTFLMGNGTGVSISPYLEKLRAMRLIADVRSFEADAKARNIRYAILDPLTRFWNLFVQPNRLAIDQGGGQELFETSIRRQLSDYMMLAFEDMCREYARCRLTDRLNLAVKTVGQAWGPGYNLAITGRLEDGTPLFGACEWHTRPVGEAGFEHLVHQAGLMMQSSGGQAPHAVYTLFSRSGFTSELMARADQSATLTLLTPDDILGRVA